MNNLQSLKSELLLQYSQQEIEQWNRKNFYLHHNLPARSSVKSRQGSQKTRVRSALRIAPKKLAALHNNAEEIVGRKLFYNAQKVKVPGPGSYDFALQRHSSHCYIKKEQDFVKGKIAKKLRRRQLINECRGPGIYNPELAFNHTSKTRTNPQTKFSETYFTRCILPQAKKEGLYLTSTLSQRFIRNNDTPGPQKYEMSLSKADSNMRRPVVHLMSMTERSSLVKPEVAPGPGFYKLGREFQPANGNKPGKGKIQYKFVYGHPS